MPPEQSVISAQSEASVGCPEGYLQNTMTGACYFIVFGANGEMGVDPLVEGQSPDLNTFTGSIVALGPDPGRRDDLIYVEVVVNGRVEIVPVSQHALWKQENHIGVAQIQAVFPSN